MKKITSFLKDPKIFVVTIIWMMVIVAIGTIQQKYHGLFTVQERYFSSWIIWFSFFPTPGGRLTLIVMLINLSFSFFNKSIWKIKKLGIVVIHLGAILLLVGGGLTAIFSSEGNMVIDEGKQANHVEDYFYFELAVINTSKSDFDEYTIFDQPLFKENQILTHKNLNFEIEILNYFDNCQPLQRNSAPKMQYKGMLKNIMLQKIPSEKEENRNRPGIIYQISNSGSNADGVYANFLNQAIPQTISIKEESYEVVLRRKRTYLPFSIQLIDFKKVLHPGTNIAKSYSSEINLLENGTSRNIIIKMNEPLRHKGYTFYQSSFIDGSSIETTVLAAVKNYGRLYPYISSIIMCIGLLFHLAIKLPDLFKKVKTRL